MAICKKLIDLHGGLIRGRNLKNGTGVIFEILLPDCVLLKSEKEGIKFITLKEAIQLKSQIQLCNPSPSSWGQGGFHNYWLNESNAWIVHEWSKAGREMVDICTKGIQEESHIKILKQAARELLLFQSSDWSFILKAGTTTELARERINLHIKRFWMLINAIKDNKIIEPNVLEKIEKEENNENHQIKRTN